MAGQTTDLNLSDEISKTFSEATLHHKSGALTKAAEMYRRVIVLAGDNKEHEEAVILALLRLGDIHVQFSRLDQALQCYEEGESKSRAISFSAGELECAARKSNIFMKSGLWDKARQVAANGVKLAVSSADKHYQPIFAGILGQIERRSGNFDKALEWAMDGLKLAQENDDLDEELTFLSDMSIIALMKNDLESALLQADAGLRRSRETGKPDSSVVFLGQKCQVLMRMDRNDEALKCALEGLKTAQDQGNIKETATFLHDLALLYSRTDNHEDAVKHCVEAYRYFLKLEDKEGALTALLSLSRLLTRYSDWEAGFNAFVDALVLSASMDKRIFAVTFFDIRKIISILWKRKSFKEIEKGIQVVEHFFTHLEKQFTDSLQHCPVAPAADDSFLSQIREVIDCLRLLAKSRGNADSPEWSEAKKRAAAMSDTPASVMIEFIDSLVFLKK